MIDTVSRVEKLLAEYQAEKWSNEHDSFSQYNSFSVVILGPLKLFAGSLRIVL